MSDLDYLLSEKDRLETALRRTFDKELRTKYKTLLELTNEEIDYVTNKQN